MEETREEKKSRLIREIRDLTLSIRNSPWGYFTPGV
jgi:hypothetical protein